VPFIPPAVSQKSIDQNQAVIRFPNRVHRKQIYYEIEILPSSYLDGTEKFVVPVDNPTLLGFLTSSIFAVWVKGINSNESFAINDKSMYNSFPFPEVSKKQINDIERAVNYVFEARAETQFKSLSDVYLPETMPEHLLKAHENLDRVLLDILGIQHNASNEEILKNLFDRYLENLN